MIITRGLTSFYNVNELLPLRDTVAIDVSAGLHYYVFCVLRRAATSATRLRATATYAKVILVFESVADQFEF